MNLLRKRTTTQSRVVGLAGDAANKVESQLLALEGLVSSKFPNGSFSVMVLAPKAGNTVKVFMNVSVDDDGVTKSKGAVGDTVAECRKKIEDAVAKDGWDISK